MDGVEINNNIKALLEDLVTRFPELHVCLEPITKVFLLLRNIFTSGKKLLVCGNGGSAADAEHFSGELLKGFLKKRPLPLMLKTNFSAFAGNSDQWIDRLQKGLPVLPLNTNTALISAVSNDIGADLIFAQQVLSYGIAGDSILAISTTGNSDNIIKAVIVAKGLGLHTIGLTGQENGKLGDLCEFLIKVPAFQTFKVQEFHLPVYHVLAAMLEEEFFSNEN